MSLWIQVSETYHQHPKTLKLMFLLGPEADTYPIRLWSYCASHAPSGRIGPEFVETVCRWDKRKKGLLLAALTACGFISEDGEVHNWMERSGGALAEIELDRRAARNRQAKARKDRVTKTSHRVTDMSRECHSDVTVTSRERHANVRQLDGEKTEMREIEQTPRAGAGAPDLPDGHVVRDMPPKEKKPPSFHPNARDFVIQFREDFIENVRKGHVFEEGVPASELRAATKFLKAPDWSLDRIDKLKEWTMCDGPQDEPEPGKWNGWCHVIRSVAKLWDKRIELINAAGRAGKVI